MNINVEQISIVMVFMEGLLSFFSPCVVPLLPLYMGYLSSNAKTTLSDGKIVYNRGIVLLQTLCFMGGISLSFVVLGITFTSFGQFLTGYEPAFQIVAGILILILGLYQLGILKIPFLNQEKRLSMNLPLNQMNPLLAFVLGFLFSFTWTPCVGPALTSILLLTSTSSVGYLYVLVYAMGFVIPFLVLGLFTSQVLNFLRDNKKLLPAIVKIGAIILILMGCYSLYQGVVSYKSPQEEDVDSSSEIGQFPQFTLETIDGKSYTLSDYKGKIIILNFWTTWCGYCQLEVEELEVLNNMGKDDIEILSVLVVTGESEKEIEAFLAEKDISYPVLIDYGGIVASQYDVDSYPNTFVITDEYKMLGYIPGYVNVDVFLQVIEQAREQDHR